MTKKGVRVIFAAWYGSITRFKKNSDPFFVIPLAATVGLLAMACRGEADGADNIADPDAQLIHADVWADNWFALYAGEELVMEDSVPYQACLPIVIRGLALGLDEGRLYVAQNLAHHGVAFGRDGRDSLHGFAPLRWLGRDLRAPIRRDRTTLLFGG